MNDPILVSRAKLDRASGGYRGPMVLFGFRYSLLVRKSGDGIEVDVFDRDPPEPVGEYRIPLVDGEEAK